MDPAASVDRVTDIWMAGGRVASIDHAPDAFTADRVLDVAGKVVMPGLVDLSAQLREPGFEYRATLESELRAAMAGGITSAPSSATITPRRVMRQAGAYQNSVQPRHSA